MANELGQLVAAAESPRDGYLAYHNPNLTPKLRAGRLEKLTSMSIEDVVSMLEKNYHQYGAVGKYQITYPLLRKVCTTPPSAPGKANPKILIS